MSREHRTRIVNLIKKSAKKSLSINEIHARLKKDFPKITKNQIKNILIDVVKIDKILKENRKPQKYFILSNKEGNSFRYTAGGETTRKGTGPYRDITKVIDGDSNSIRKIFGAQHLNSFDVHAGKSARGSWGRPDIIVALYREIGSARYFNLHAIEYKGIGGFSASNVAQAYFGGGGADRCWLLFDSRDWPKNNSERKANPNAERIKIFAQKLGVGLIYYRNLSNSGDWFMLQNAKLQPKNLVNRDGLKHLFSEEIKKDKIKKS